MKTVEELAKIVAENIPDEDLLHICLHAGDETEVSPFEDALRREYEKRHPEDFDLPIAKPTSEDYSCGCRKDKDGFFKVCFAR